MADRISRRDFLNGVALAIGAGCSAACRPRGDAAAEAPETIQGSTDAAIACAHALRDGRRHAYERLPIEAEVDLLVIGAGISGLAAAYQHRRRDPAARILILDNQDDFGGHARRCEMHVDGRLILGYGGSESLHSPGSWSPGARGLVQELGVDLERFETLFDRDLYPGLGLSRGVLFTREAFGVDRLVPGDPTRMFADDIPRGRDNARTPEAFIADVPLAAAARASLVALYVDPRDVMAGASTAEKLRILASISYREFLLKYWHLDEAAASVFHGRSRDLFAMSIDGVPALAAGHTGYPGFQGLGLPVQAEADDEPYIFHFPDGNASIARLLVRRLVPGVAPGSTMDDVVTARFDYSRLDVPGARTRVRLDSTVVALGNRDAGVDVGYVRAGTLRRVRARHVVHAGYNMMLPYMSAELEPPQREALLACVKAPIVYAKVAVRNWEPWVKLGVHEITNPMGFFSRIKLDYPVSIGAYRCSKSPREPIGLHLVHVPAPSTPGLDMRTRWRRGRAKLLATKYQDFEYHVVDELTRALGPGGFDARRDIAAISVYRWGHGYAYGFNSLYDEPRAPALFEVARQRRGHLTVANSDAAWSATANAAIDEAARAVRELAEA